MLHVLAFNLAQLLATVYSLAKGGAPERVTGGSLLLATLFTRALQNDYAVRFARVEWSVFWVDLVLLAALMTVALLADRFWTLWLVALQALGTGAHLIRLIDHDVLRFAYAVLTAVWSYPMLLLLMAGTARHGARRKLHGRDRDWSGRALEAA